MPVSPEKASAHRQNEEPAVARTADFVKDAISDLLAEPLSPGLYLVATPIGNLADVTLRALAVLARADVVLCEDTRHSAKLLHHYAIAARTRPFHEHNEDREIARAISELEAGKRIAVISDAGTPLLSDPGFRLVRAAAAHGLPVVTIPGPSATLTALSSSALPTDSFFFAGFLPPKQAARRVRLADLTLIPGSLVIFEAPHRLSEALADMADVLGDRPAVIARELTKRHEEVVRGTLRKLAEIAEAQALKGEIVLVVGPAETATISDEAIDARLSQALDVMSLKDAAKALAGELGVPKARIYALGLKAKEKRP